MGNQPTPRLSDREKKDIVTLYWEGYSMLRIVAITGRSYGTVNKYIHRSNLTVKGRGGNNRKKSNDGERQAR